MASKTSKIFIIILIILIIKSIFSRRSFFRPIDPYIPEIQTKWIHGTNIHILKNYYFEYKPLFEQFDCNYFFLNLIPNKEIKFRNSNKFISGSKLKEMAENLLIELNLKKNTYKDFIILKDRDFNFITTSGYIILKYKNYPFVLKLSIETPFTFTQPYSKGWQSICFYTMGGGINRYLLGFNRIKNMQWIRKKIKSNPYWSNIVDTPRKWFWLPDNCKWFELIGKNISQKKEAKIYLPAAYGIITDAIESSRNPNIMNKEDREFAMKLCKFLGNRIDPHIDNGIWEKNTGLFVIIDFEPFYKMVGLKKPFKFNSYFEWYAKLSAKCFTDNYCRTKKDRRRLQM